MNTMMLDALDLTKMIQATQRPRVADGVDPIKIGKTLFHYGVVTRSDSVLHVALDGNAARFSVQVGVDVRKTVHRDDPVDPATSHAEFLIQGDGRVLARSGRMNYGEDAKRFEVDLAGIRNLVLSVTGGPGHTHASWADGVFSYNGQAPVTVLTQELQSLWREKMAFLQALADRHPEPRINGALVVGVRPDTPLLYPMAVTGKRPMTFLAQGLPDGLSLDPRTGIISGQAGKAGDYQVGLQATNAHGKAEAILTIRVGDTLCLTPPMGFLSWNVTEGLVNETFLRETAEAMVELGLRDVGYQYVNIDDCWQGSRDTHGVLHPSAIRFPNGMKAVADEVHSRGLKLGIYSGPCRTTCAGYHGSMNFEELDCATWQDWGIDYLKYDNAPDTPGAVRQALFDTVGEILVRGKRSIVYSISAGNIVRTAKHANLARVAGDLRDHWERRKKNHGEGVIESVERAVEFKGEQIPGFFNDPDMLMVGIHGRGASANDCTDCQGMSDTEYQSQISLWCMLGAPLFVAADIRMLDVPALRMLTNPEVIAIDQDPLCEAPRIIRIGDHHELWCRRLVDGSFAMALFNRGENESTLTARWADCGLPESCHVRDLWLRQDVGMVRASLTASVPGHGVAVFKVRPLEDKPAGLGPAALSADIDVGSFLTANNPEALRLVEDIFRECVQGKISDPAGVLRHTWITAGGGYVGQWLWDPMFVLDLLSLLPNQQEIIRDVFRNYWDYQVCWNARQPAYAHDLVPCMIVPDEEKWLKELPGRHPVSYSQIPILAWGVERVYQRNHDQELLELCLGPIERFHEWYWRERDVTDVGLVAVGAYNGIVQDARFETFDYECNLDDLKLTRHPTRQGTVEGEWYGDICVSGNTAYLIMAENSLLRLANIAGDKAMVARRKARIDKAVAAMRQHMWDEEAGCFLSIRRDTLEKIPVATIGSWIALAAEVPTQAMARRMAAVLQSERWVTPLPVPTVDRTDKRWKSDGFWRGDVWPATNYQIASGLARYGYTALAADIVDKTVENAIQHGISEHYDSVSGKALGVRFLGMSCSIATMMLDGLGRKYAVSAITKGEVKR